MVNGVQDNHKKLVGQIQHMQSMMQAMQLQYAALQQSYQAYGGHRKGAITNIEETGKRVVDAVEPVV